MDNLHGDCVVSSRIGLVGLCVRIRLLILNDIVRYFEIVENGAIGCCQSGGYGIHVIDVGICPEKSQTR